jgi:hypothetical protein
MLIAETRSPNEADLDPTNPGCTVAIDAAKVKWKKALSFFEVHWR